MPINKPSNETPGVFSSSLFLTLGCLTLISTTATTSGYLHVPDRVCGAWSKVVGVKETRDRLMVTCRHRSGETSNRVIDYD